MNGHMNRVLSKQADPSLFCLLWQSIVAQVHADAHITVIYLF